MEARKMRATATNMAYKNTNEDGLRSAIGTVEGTEVNKEIEHLL